MNLLLSILIGAVAGWLAGVIMKSKSTGLLLNIILGILGGFIGNWIFEFFGLSSDNALVGALISATIGAAILIILKRMLFKKK